jgi:1-acyl-sn-glycerol-3-phosphate acyltransferase
VILSLIIYLSLIIHSGIYIIILAFLILPKLPFLTYDERQKELRLGIVKYGQWCLRYALFPFVKIKYQTFTDEKTPGIYIANHRAGSDGYIAGLIDCDLVQLVSRWPFKIPVLGKFAKWANYISVFEHSVDELTEKMRIHLENGISIVAFPEGHRTGSKTMLPFNSLMFRVALATKVPIYPLCITGNETIPDKKFIMHSGTIKVHKLPPLKWEDYKDLSPFKLKNKVHDIILKETEKMDNEGNK